MQPYYSMAYLEDLACQDTCLHRIHPLVKLMTTLIYLVLLMSFDKYEISGLIPFVFYPFFILIFAELPAIRILKRMLIVGPFIVGIGILNPWFDHNTTAIGGIVFSKGWYTFISILLKYSLAVIVSILLIATTGMNRLSVALRILKVPKIFVLQLLLTYRYISVLAEEVFRMQRAYSLRAPGQTGIQRKVWGSFVGQLILRTFDRGQRVYGAMVLRGFSGEYIIGSSIKFRISDFVYFVGWVSFFSFARIYDLPILLEQIFVGVINK